MIFSLKERAAEDATGGDGSGSEGEGLLLQVGVWHVWGHCQAELWPTQWSEPTGKKLGLVHWDETLLLSAREELSSTRTHWPRTTQNRTLTISGLWSWQRWHLSQISLGLKSNQRCYFLQRWLIENHVYCYCFSSWPKRTHHARCW